MPVHVAPPQLNISSIIIMPWFLCIVWNLWNPLHAILRGNNFSICSISPTMAKVPQSLLNPIPLMCLHPFWPNTNRHVNHKWFYMSALPALSIICGCCELPANVWQHLRKELFCIWQQLYPIFTFPKIWWWVEKVYISFLFLSRFYFINLYLCTNILE